MKRIIATVGSLSLFCAVWQALSLHIPEWMNSLFLPPIILVFCLQYFYPFETSIICLFSGMVIDMLGGFAIGSNMLLMSGLAYLFNVANEFKSRMERRDLFYYVIAMSFIYRIALMIFHYLLLGKKANIAYQHLLIGPFIDGIASFVCYSLLIKILISIKAADGNDFSDRNIRLGR